MSSNWGRPESGSHGNDGNGGGGSGGWSSRNQGGGGGGGGQWGRNNRDDDRIPRRNEQQHQLRTSTSSSDNWRGRGSGYDGTDGGRVRDSHRDEYRRHEHRHRDHYYHDQAGRYGQQPRRDGRDRNHDRPSHGHGRDWDGDANISRHSRDGRIASGYGRGSTNEDIRASKKPKVGEPPAVAASSASADTRGNHMREAATPFASTTAPSSFSLEADYPSLETLVTKKTMVEGKCSWDQMIAAQHPDMPTEMNRPWPQGKTYLRPNKKVEEHFPVLGRLQYYSKGEAWFDEKKAAAKKVFEDVSAEADFDYCPKELRKFFDALPYNATFTIGFDAIGIFPEDEKNCLCPFSNKCAKWRKQFDLEEILDDFQRDNCGKTLQSSTPHGLMQHLQNFNKNKQGLHHYVELYLRELYGPPFRGTVGHKGLYQPYTKENLKAAAYEVMENHLAREKLERELEEERQANRAKEEEQEKRRKELEGLTKLSIDLAKQIKQEKENAKLLNLRPSRVDESRSDMDPKTLTSLHSLYRAVFQNILYGVESGRGKAFGRSTGGSADIKVRHSFQIEQLFDELYDAKPRSFLFAPVDSVRGGVTVGALILRDWNILFDTKEELNLKKIKSEIQAIDEGGPSREFMAQAWKRFTELKVTADAEVTDGSNILALVHKTGTHYAMFTEDDVIDDFINRVPPENQDETKERIEVYYQGIGRLFLHAFAMDMKIPTTCFPRFYRNVLLRGCAQSADNSLGDDEEDYPRSEIMKDIKTMGFPLEAEECIDKLTLGTYGLDFNGVDADITSENFFNVFLQRYFVDSRSTALKNVMRGLTLDGKLDIRGVFSVMKPAIMENIAFVSESLTVEHVLEFLDHRYCTSIKYEIDGGLELDQPVEPQLIEEQRLFYKETLPKVLRECYSAEKDDDEGYSEKVRRHNDFLSCFVRFATGSPFLPHPSVKSRSDMITIEFQAIAEDSLPSAHTCSKDVVFPHFSYGNSAELLSEKLMNSLRATKFDAFGMQ